MQQCDMLAGKRRGGAFLRLPIRPAFRHQERACAEVKVVKERNTYAKTVPVEEMFRYPEAVLVNDIVSPEDGILIVSRGRPLKNFARKAEIITGALRSWGVREIKLEFEAQVTVEEMTTLLDHIDPSVRQIDREVSGKVLDRLSGVHRALSGNDAKTFPREEIEDAGRMLSEEIHKSSQVLLSLGVAHDADEYTYVHSLNVGLLAGYLAKCVQRSRGLAYDITKTAVTTGLLHDIGKAKIPREILNKPERLTDEEFHLVKTHAELSFTLAKESGVEDSLVLSGVLSHHERWDGSGYPQGLKGEKIPLLARLVGVADVFDALTTKRVYKEPVSAKKALSIILANSGTGFDPGICNVLLSGVGIYPPSTVVELSDGTVGTVALTGDGNLLQPKVLVKESGGNCRIVDLQAAGLYIARCLDLS